MDGTRRDRGEQKIGEGRMVNGREGDEREVMGMEGGKQRGEWTRRGWKGRMRIVGIREWKGNGSEEILVNEDACDLTERWTQQCTVSSYEHNSTFSRVKVAEEIEGGALLAPCSEVTIGTPYHWENAQTRKRKRDKTVTTSQSQTKVYGTLIRGTSTGYTSAAAFEWPGTRTARHSNGQASAAWSCLAIEFRSHDMLSHH
jgi:hypothetical protein